jgi:hypothetical protein
MWTEGLPEKDWTPWQREQMHGWSKRFIRDSQELRIEEWKIRQDHRRDHVNLAEIADWCARRRGDIERDPNRRMQACSDLQQSIQRGEFSKGGRLKVVYLGPLPDLPHPEKLRLDAGQFRKWLRSGAILSQVLELCWVPRDLCVRWFEARGMEAPPWLAGTALQENTQVGDTVGAKRREASDFRAPEGKLHDTSAKVQVAAEAEPAKELIPPPRQAEPAHAEANSLDPDAPLGSFSRAPEGSIDDAVATVYTDAKKEGKKPPNIKQVIQPVKKVLHERGLDATYDQIIKSASKSQHKSRRLSPGPTWKFLRKAKSGD